MAIEAENIPREAALVAVTDEHLAVQRAVNALFQAGFPMDRVSVAGKDGRTEQHLIGFCDAGDRVKVWGRLGAFWGSIAGMLTGSAFLIVPNVGHLLVFGPLSHWIMAGLEGAAVVGGVSALGAGLVSVRVPHASLGAYEADVRSGSFLVVVTGTLQDIQHARAILRRVSGLECHDYGAVAAMAG